MRIDCIGAECPVVPTERFKALANIRQPALSGGPHSESIKTARCCAHRLQSITSAVRRGEALEALSRSTSTPWFTTMASTARSMSAAMRHKQPGRFSQESDWESVARATESCRCTPSESRRKMSIDHDVAEMMVQPRLNECSGGTSHISTIQSDAVATARSRPFSPPMRREA